MAQERESELLELELSERLLLDFFFRFFVFLSFSVLSSPWSQFQATREQGSATRQAMH